MKPETKVATIIVCYCATLWLTNWTFDREFDRDQGLISSGVNVAGWGILAGIVLTFVLLRRVWAVLRVLLDLGIRVPFHIRLWGRWSALWLLLPLGLSFTHHASGVADDGATVRSVFSYGTDVSGYVALFGATSIMLFQLLVRLESFVPNKSAEQAGDGDALPRPC